MKTPCLKQEAYLCSFNKGFLWSYITERKEILINQL